MPPQKDTKCVICKETIHLGLDEHYNTVRGTICLDCVNQYGNMPYNFRPDIWEFKATNRGESEFIGVEYEFEAIDGDIGNLIFAKISMLQSLPFRMHFVHDGSLRNGSECVWHPLSWSYLRANKLAIEDSFNDFKQYTSVWRNGRCGLHTHHTRAGYTSTEIYKLLMFYIRYKDFFKRIGGKTSGSYDRYASEPTKVRSEILNYLGGGRIWPDPHHRGINLENEKTIELRFFRNTAKFTSFWGSLQFNKALMDFIRVGSFAEMSPLPFLGFVEKHKYSEALKLIEERL